MHPSNQPRHVIKKNVQSPKTQEDLKVMKSVMNVVGASAMCQDGSTTAGELQRLLSDGTLSLSESSRKVYKSGHYRDPFEVVDNKDLRKMHTGGNSEPPWYSLVRTLMRKGYLPEEIAKLLDKSRAELSKALVPGGV